MPNYRENQIETVQDFVKLVDQEKDKAITSGNNADLIFRGQRRDLPLLPKLARLRLQRKLKGEIRNIEKLMIDEFQRTSRTLYEFQPSDEWDLLALAQHHGLPTRLLDWTYSALAALWFAVKDPPFQQESGNEGYGVVWVLAAVKEDFRTDTLKFGPMSNRITKIFRPKIISSRISAQQGLFTVHKINEDERVIRFEYNRNFSKKLLKIKIPPLNFPRIRHRLNILGVNCATLFPDMDGLCNHLLWRYSYLDDEENSCPL
jgi:hypothetical protein